MFELRCLLEEYGGISDMRYFILGGITDGDSTFDNVNNMRLKNACRNIGRALNNYGHSLIICSPFKDSADYWTLNGFIQNNQNQHMPIEIHYVDMESVRAEVAILELNNKEYKFNKVPHSAPININKESISYAWLLCQLNALESCRAVIAIGGKVDGVANMLLLLAEAKRKPVLPLSFLGGAAGLAFQRRRYELEDRLGDKYLLLQDEKCINELIEGGEMICALQKGNKAKGSNPKFFISYPRTRPAEADYIETLLRRRNMEVYRDESDFGAGSEIPTKITEAIYAADIFIAVWCAEYACSPWCFDEFELALDRHESCETKLWIFCVDNTRIIPKRARNLNWFNVRSREEIEGRVLNLLQFELEK